MIVQLNYSTNLCMQFVISQHGFLNGKSAIINLCVYIDDVFDTFRKREIVDSVCTYFVKAFDVVNVVPKIKLRWCAQTSIELDKNKFVSTALLIECDKEHFVKNIIFSES